MTCGCPIVILTMETMCIACHVDEGLIPYRVSQQHMGTQATLVFYAPSQTVANQVSNRVFQRIAALDSCFSDYNSQSELVRFGRSSHDATTLPIPLKLSEDMWNVVIQSQRISCLSAGAFDITVGPLSQLWRATKKSGKLPSRERLQACLTTVGWRHLHLDQKNRTGQLLCSKMSLDAGGIAKGYAADAALSVLRKLGVTRAMVNLGGDMSLGDPPPHCDGWPIELSPAGGKDDVTFKLRLAHCGVATSGDAWQYVEIGGQRYSHVLDPVTGMGLTARRGVSVVAATGMEADALASAVCVMGWEKGFGLLKEFVGASGLCAEHTATGVRIYCSEEFHDLGGKTCCLQQQSKKVSR